MLRRKDKETFLRAHVAGTHARVVREKENPMHVPAKPEESPNDGTTDPADNAPAGPVFQSLAVSDVTFQDAGHLIAELLTAIEHEFRTPLAVIQGYTSTLLLHDQRLSPEERREFHTAIAQASTKMARLLAQVLELVQLETGMVHVEEGTVDVPQIVRAAITRAHRQVPASLHGRVTFHLHLRDERKNEVQEVPLVLGNPESIHKIVMQLLENALQFSPEGGRIDVIVQPVAAQQLTPPLPQQTPTFLEVCVCDYGIGIPQEHLERIFERFYRIETTPTQQTQNLGLGLAVCRHLVTLHQGRIWAESCLAGGSAFHVWLPTASAVAE
jgi:signal transduction histidine kinase